ncbi:MAG: hypothetical protein GVY12_02235 [Bacteroidetes bacterium]|jgi:hypothetical protein|nr:hypothetical protein [Bacteroidota bacterium]
MSLKIKPLDEVNEEAVRVLTRELGVANTARLLRQFTTGSGNYTEERKELFEDQSLDDLLELIRERRKER